MHSPSPYNCRFSFFSFIQDSSSVLTEYYNSLSHYVSEVELKWIFTVLNFQKYNLFRIFQVINIVVGDGLPKFICTDCQGVINKFTDFCNMVQDVQKRLEEEKLDFSQVRKFLSSLHTQFEAKKIQWDALDYVLFFFGFWVNQVLSLSVLNDS